MEVERLIITFADGNPGVFYDRLAEIGAVEGVVDVDSWWSLNRTVLATVEADDEDVVDDLEDLPFVARVQHDRPVSATALQYEPITIAADLKNQTTAGLYKYLAYYREGLRPRISVPWTRNQIDYAVPVNPERQGEGIYVCVMDSGIEPTNSEFGGRTIIALPRRGLDSIGFHGTACAQHIGGNTLGLAPGCTFIDANCFGDSSTTSSSNIVASMGDLADYVNLNLTNGEMVVCNMSFGAISEGTFDAPLAEMQGLGIVCFTSAGNDDSDNSIYHPSSLLRYGTVGATDYWLQRTRFSNWGANVFAHGPGQDMPYIGTLEDASADDQVTLISGTSFSCPYVVGCFVTWVAGKPSPQNQEEAEFMQKVFLRDMGMENAVTDKPGTSDLDTSQAVFITAENAEIAPSLFVDSGLEVILDRNAVQNGVAAQYNELLLTYGGTMTDLFVTNNPAILGGTGTTTSGRFPAAFADKATAILCDGSSRTFTIPNDENDVWISFYGRFTNVTDVNRTRPFVWIDHEGATPGPAIGIAADKTLVRGVERVDAGAPSSADASYTSLGSILAAANTLNRYDIHIVFEETDPLNSTFEVYVDNVLMYQKLNQPRNSGAVPWRKAISIGQSHDWRPFEWFYLSNFRISTADTRGKEFMSLSLDAVGNYNQFDLDGFDALVDPNSSKVARSQTAGQRVSGTLDFASIPDNGAISEVKLVSVGAVDSATPNPNALAHFVRSGGTDYDQASVEVTNWRTTILTSMPTNPATAAAWALADLNGMEFGLLSGNV